MKTCMKLVLSCWKSNDVSAEHHHEVVHDQTYDDPPKLNKADQKSQAINRSMQNLRAWAKQDVMPPSAG